MQVFKMYNIFHICLAVSPFLDSNLLFVAVYKLTYPLCLASLITFNATKRSLKKYTPRLSLVVDYSATRHLSSFHISGNTFCLLTITKSKANLSKSTKIKDQSFQIKILTITYKADLLKSEAKLATDKGNLLY